MGAASIAFEASGVRAAAGEEVLYLVSMRGGVSHARGGRGLGVMPKKDSQSNWRLGAADPSDVAAEVGVRGGGGAAPCVAEDPLSWPIRTAAGGFQLLDAVTGDLTVFWEI